MRKIGLKPLLKNDQQLLLKIDWQRFLKNWSKIVTQKVIHKKFSKLNHKRYLKFTKEHYSKSNHN